MSPEQLMQRAERARQLIEDPMIVEALDMIEREVIDQWGACPVRDVDGREMLWRLYMTARKFRGVFIGTVQSGQLAGLRKKPNALSQFMNLVR